ncbi:LysM peptidoglycan-binding domain-containing protein [Candidatus Protochlamydia phocaeensis]|uniref:LysM peptidoglycan-binding domain-containing protein n=1 Tax=Candidatus Protochlamydia phocaeensis TaxID=1414722 RepID=UPI000838DFDF|nr:LysM peptidoglycan-binding domain-containing protein [Candidatus Protochlamydia phocaeensis]
MTRKDTILIAVVINAGLLAILFATAIIYDTDKVIDKVLEQSEFSTSLVEAEKANETNLIAAAGPATDEVDNVLKYYTQPAPQPLILESQAESYIHEPIAVQSNADDDELPQGLPAPASSDRFVEVTVKKGDVLEKIARANGTTVGAIKRANQLQSERLSIGQTLKIPVKGNGQALASASNAQPAKKASEKKEESGSEAVYYVIKSGDNPWKIAKQFNVKFEDILRLNQLDEERARNLKVGDRIRVK